MIICIAGVTITQGFWLFKDYQFYSEQEIFASDRDVLIKVINLENAPNLKPSKDQRSVMDRDAKKKIPTMIPEIVGRIQIESFKGPPSVTGPAPGYKAVKYKAPTMYVLKKMKLQFGISFLLISFTTICFVYMIMMLIRQRKAAIAKNHFINDMTHELKTPLATVSVVIDSLKSYDGYEDKEKKDLYLDISRNEVDHLNKLIELILQQAVFDTQVMEMLLKPTDVNVLLDRLKEKYSLSNSDFNFVLHQQKEMPFLLIDPVHINNVIRNLIDNAIKYSKESKNIMITSSTLNNQWKLSVQDDGIGIPKIHHSEIFERFFRVPESKNGIKGFGLGLTYAKQVVVLHKGKIHLESESGKGSTFTIVIPLS